MEQRVVIERPRIIHAARAQHPEQQEDGSDARTPEDDFEQAGFIAILVHAKLLNG